MHCPRTVCKSVNILRIKRYTATTSQTLPPNFAGLNIARRRVKCLKCGELFWTIEMAEDDFQKFFDKSAAIKVAGV